MSDIAYEGEYSSGRDIWEQYETAQLEAPSQVTENQENGIATDTEEMYSMVPLPTSGDPSMGMDNEGMSTMMENEKAVSISMAQALNLSSENAVQVNAPRPNASNATPNASNTNYGPARASNASNAMGGQCNPVSSISDARAPNMAQAMTNAMDGSFSILPSTNAAQARENGIQPNVQTPSSPNTTRSNVANANYGSSRAFNAINTNYSQYNGVALTSGVSTLNMAGENMNAVPVRAVAGAVAGAMGGRNNAAPSISGASIHVHAANMNRVTVQAVTNELEDQFNVLRPTSAAQIQNYGSACATESGVQYNALLAASDIQVHSRDNKLQDNAPRLIVDNANHSRPRTSNADVGMSGQHNVSANQVSNGILENVVQFIATNTPHSNLTNTNEGPIFKHPVNIGADMARDPIKPSSDMVKPNNTPLAGKPNIYQCFVSGCNVRRGQGFTLFPLPKVYKSRHPQSSLTTQRNTAWLKAINCGNLSKEEYKLVRICSGHFMSGKLSP